MYIQMQTNKPASDVWILYTITQLMWTKIGFPIGEWVSTRPKLLNWDHRFQLDYLMAMPYCRWWISNQAGFPNWDKVLQGEYVQPTPKASSMGIEPWTFHIQDLKAPQCARCCRKRGLDCWWWNIETDNDKKKYSPGLGNISISPLVDLHLIDSSTSHNAVPVNNNSIILSKSYIAHISTNKVLKAPSILYKKMGYGSYEFWDPIM